jgi:hypothetical protein
MRYFLNVIDNSPKACFMTKQKTLNKGKIGAYTEREILTISEIFVKECAIHCLKPPHSGGKYRRKPEHQSIHPKHQCTLFNEEIIRQF